MGETAGNLSRGLDSYSYRQVYSLSFKSSSHLFVRPIFLFTAQPLGVTAGICPFNFPAMIPLWMFPVGNLSLSNVFNNATNNTKRDEHYARVNVLQMSNGCGNSMLLKPSEKDPGASMILARLAQKAGLPDGVLQVHTSSIIAPI